MLIQGQVGPQSATASLGVGTQPPARFGNMGELVVGTLHGDHYEANYRRSLYAAANQTGVVTTVGPALTYTGLCLSNPVGSGINVSINDVGLSFLVAFPAAASIGVMVGYNSSTNVTHTTPVTPRSMFVGVGVVGQALVDSSCTFPTAPTLTNVLGAGLTGAITTATGIMPMNWDASGAIILPPGGYAAIWTSTVSGAAAMFASFLWEEVPQ